MFSVCFFITAAILYFFPRKRVNHFYGYRTPMSVRSQERWDFSQKYFAIQMAKAGIVVMVLAFSGLLLLESKTIRLWGSVFIVFVAITYMYSSTESELKKRFSEIKK